MGAPADGYSTLLLVGLPNAINASLYDNLNFDFIRDIAPVASIVGVPNVMLVNPAFPAKTIPEFIAYAKANPGKINMASAGEGTFSHLCGELFKLATGIDLVHVPYKGGARTLTDVLGEEHVQLIFSGVSVSLGYIKSVKLRALGVTTSARLELLPDIPTVGESVAGAMEARRVQEGLGAPKNTPADVIDRLNGAVKTALADPKIKASFSDLGNVPMPMTPAPVRKACHRRRHRKVAQGDPSCQHQGGLSRGFRVVMGAPYPTTPAALDTMAAQESERWAKVVREASIKRNAGRRGGYTGLRAGAVNSEPQSPRSARLNTSPSRRENSCLPADPSGWHNFKVTRAAAALAAAVMMRAPAAAAGARDSATHS